MAPRVLARATIFGWEQLQFSFTLSEGVPSNNSQTTRPNFLKGLHEAAGLTLRSQSLAFFCELFAKRKALGSGIVFWHFYNTTPAIQWKVA
jgi:hypothetical protein